MPPAMIAAARLVLAALLWCVAFAASAQESDWRRAESEHFVVYASRGETQLREATQALEDFDAALRILTHLPAAPDGNKLDVYLLDGASDLQNLGNFGNTVRGFYSATPEQVAAFAIYRDRGTREIVLFHEYAHHFMLHNFPNAYPSWYVEGWAEFVSTAEVDGRRLIFGRPSDLRSEWIRADGMLPIEHLLAPHLVDDGDRFANFTALFYAQSWFAAAYVANTPERQRGLQRYIAALGDGADPIEGFQPAFGISPDQFDSELRRFRRGRVQVISVRLPDEPANVAISRLPGWADDLILALAGARRGYAEHADETSNAERLARLGQASVDAEGGMLALAYAARLRGDEAGVRTQAARLLALQEGHSEARFLLAQSYYRAAGGAGSPEAAEAALRESRRHLALGFRANPNHFPTLYLYALTFADAPAPLTSEQLDVLARAVELAPRASDMRLRLADELIEAREFENAVAVLRPLMYAPHNGRLGARVRVVMEAARRAEQPPPWAPEEDEDED
jgi:hypothetical protein